MTTMAEKLRSLERWESAINSAEQTIATLHRPLGLQPEGGQIMAFVALEKAITKVTAELIGDCAKWLDWYRFENDMGDRALEAGPSGQLRKIRCLEDLLWVIEVKK